MVYGCPTLNLSQYSGAEYNSQDGAVSTWTVAEILIGPLIFVSPSHVRLFVSLNARSGNVTTIQGSYYDSTLTARCKVPSAAVKRSVTTGGAGSDSFVIPHILNADFSDISGDNRIDSIELRSKVYIDGLSLEPSIAQTYISGSPDTTYKFYIEWIEQAFVVVGKNSILGRTSNYSQHCCLSPNPVAGQTHRIKNGSAGMNVYLHAFDKAIDNKNSNLYFSASLTGREGDAGGATYLSTYTFSENGFILPPLHACMLVYDGAKWLIQEYFNGTRDAYSYNWVASIPPSPCPVVSKPVVCCDISAANSKYIQLPDPAGPLKLIRIIAFSSTQNMANVVRIYPFPGSRLEDNASNSMYLRAYNGVQNACMTLLSDGVQWWVANVYDGYNCAFTTQTDPRTITTKPIAIVRTADGVRLPAVTLSPGLANETFVKMDATSPYNGVVIGTTDSTNVRIGSGTNNCIYAASPWKNYTAASLVGMYNGANTVYFVTGYFSGF